MYPEERLPVSEPGTDPLLAAQADSATSPMDPSHLIDANAVIPPRRLLLSTILESSQGSGSAPSQAGSESGCNSVAGPDSPDGSSNHSELSFDAMDLLEVIEVSPSAADPNQTGVTSQTRDAWGRPIITVVLPEEVRVLKDSAREVHEEAGGSKLGKGQGSPSEQEANADPSPGAAAPSQTTV